MSAPINPNTVNLPGGGFINGPVHGSPLHIDVIKNNTKIHIPYEGQTTIDMFDNSSNLMDQMCRITDYNLGTFRADKSY